MHIKKVGLLLAFTLTGCQSPEVVDAGYTYVPKQLHSSVIEYLKSEEFTNLSSPEESYYFNESESLVEVTLSAETDMMFVTPYLRNDLLNALCSGDDEWSIFMRNTGLGVKYILRDSLKRKQIGPWNTDACEYLEKNKSSSA
ncbi:hypothetical protein V4D06_11655 [Vibrio mimicus]|uniref:hypothetical protein n=1 Tax=Vibrio mimicus TaxID=674 RepID=UPI002F958490